MADDRSRLEKLVGMLGSDNENEALVALRMIKKMAEKEKKSLAELLLTGQTQPQRSSRPRAEQPRNPAASRPPDPPRQSQRAEGQYQDYYWSFSNRRRSFFEDVQAETLDTRDILDALKDIANEGDFSALDMEQVEFVQTVPFKYKYDWELTNKQRGFAKVLIRAWKRGKAEPLI